MSKKDLEPQINRLDIAGSKLSELMGGIKLPDNPGGLTVISTTFAILGKKIYLGRDSNGYPHLLVPQSSSHEGDIPPIAAMVNASNREWANPDGTIQPYLDLVCQSNSADDLFAAMSLSICEQLDPASVSTPSSLLRVVFDQVAHWRKVLEAISVIEASASEKLGLIGELLALECLVAKLGIQAYSAWFGQEKTRHDFEFADRAYEIKASTRTSGTYATIHGLNQLSFARGTTLNLVHFQIEWAAGGDSISGILERLEILGITQKKLQTKMENTWKVLSQPPKWFRDYEFKVTRVSRYEVDETFPSISGAILGIEVASKITNLQYTLNLSGVEPRSSSSTEISIENVINYD